MTPQQLFDRFRGEVADTEADYLWTDDEVWGYMRDAQHMLFRLTGGKRDATSAATVIPVVTGYEWAPLHKAVLLIRGVRLESTGAVVPVVSYDDVAAGIGPIQLTDLQLEGDVKAVVLGMDGDALRVVHTPVADDNLLLVIERGPLEDPTEEARRDDENAFECGDEHRIHLLKWMKHLAYGKQDADTFDKGKSEDFERQFAGYCGQVKDEKERRNHKPRLITYGGL